MKNQRYGAAVHEAGHVVVARALGLRTQRMIAGIDGDDTKGKAEIEHAAHLPVIDQIAVCVAGIHAQAMLDAETDELAAFSDMAKVNVITEGHDEAEAKGLRFAGYARSDELLKLHRAAVERLAAALAECGELDHDEIEGVLACSP